MSDMTYRKFVQRWEDVVDMPPQTVGPFTSVYKQITKRLKIMPWPWFAGASLLIAVGLYMLWGSAIIGLVSLLQKGF